jgi:glycosyltransferase involved in cell wall biosynthesis
MRIVIDMQGAQTESRFCGIGRYTLSLARAIVCERGEHEIILALNGLFPDTIEPIRAAFDGLLPQENIRVWYAPGPVRECEPGNEWRREVAERIRESFFASLRPDVVHVSSLFEGFFDNAVTSIGIFAPKLSTVVTLYNADSVMIPDSDFKTSPAYEQYNLRKIETLKCARGWLRLTDLPIQSGDERDVPVLERVIVVSNGHAGTGKWAEIISASPNKNGVNSNEVHMNATWTENARKAIAIYEGLCMPTGENRQIDCSVNTLIQHIGAINSTGVNEQDLLTTASAIAANHPEGLQKRLYVDISDLVRKDLQTGIQRATRNILSALLNNPPEGYQVEPVYATMVRQGYCHAKRYAQQFAEILGESQMDDAIDPQPGDIFLGLDFAADIVTAQQNYLKWMRNRGVCVYFVVYDLLPIKLPHAFPLGVEAGHRQWLQAIAGFDGAICISQVVQSDLDTWLKEYGPKRLRPFKTDWFHLSADMENSSSTRGVQDNAKDVLDQLAVRPSFLMVGTLEPRKGYAQTLAAFDQLWDDNVEANLVIVGKEGWMVDKLVKKLRQHPEHNHRLFWLEGISDEYLEKIYTACTCLIAASEDEGFGLPLIEAAKYALPIIARDIPVFREVAGEGAWYFSGKDTAAIASAVMEWLRLYKKGIHPQSIGVSWPTWSQSAASLIASCQLYQGSVTAAENLG